MALKRKEKQGIEGKEKGGDGRQGVDIMAGLEIGPLPARKGNGNETLGARKISSKELNRPYFLELALKRSSNSSLSLSLSLFTLHAGTSLRTLAKRVPRWN